jgi:hypothetical protein
MASIGNQVDFNGRPAQAQRLDEQESKRKRCIKNFVVHLLAL